MYGRECARMLEKAKHDKITAGCIEGASVS
jgi:hypothetical protein